MDFERNGLMLHHEHRGADVALVPPMRKMHGQTPKMRSIRSEVAVMR